ncbi:hypothetical protein QOZ80_1AG0040390 [Eleusine coracana subsp. coracana]|nr:hypothetical protein QOZ80_1AG0040390 [Eleusine coracana subsp. coracana]
MAGSSSVSSSLSDTLAALTDEQDERRVSPIKYRTGPLDYFLAVLCHCQKKATLWISWSDDNPGRQYVKCYNARTLLVDLRNAVWTTKIKRVIMKQLMKEALAQIEVQEKELTGLKQEVARFFSLRS